MPDETVTVTVRGTVLESRQLAAMISGEGGEIEVVSAPVEQRDAGGAIAVGVSIWAVTKLGDAVVRKLIAGWRAKHPAASADVADYRDQRGYR